VQTLQRVAHASADTRHVVLCTPSCPGGTTARKGMPSRMLHAHIHVPDVVSRCPGSVRNYHDTAGCGACYHHTAGRRSVKHRLACVKSSSSGCCRRLVLFLSCNTSRGGCQHLLISVRSCLHEQQLLNSALAAGPVVSLDVCWRMSRGCLAQGKALACDLRIACAC
jgi:hypothetical protein